jgi:hypothetical protein
MKSAARRIAITIRDIVRLHARDSPRKAITAGMPNGDVRLAGEDLNNPVEKKQNWICS